MDLIGCKVTIMQNRNTNLNDIYMSDRLQAQLQQIDQYAMTCVVAPMGYGKTTAVNWFLGERSKVPGTRVVRISIYSDSLASSSVRVKAENGAECSFPCWAAWSSLRVSCRAAILY